MNRTPINPETMHKLKQINEDELKENKINTIVTTIYDNTVAFMNQRSINARVNATKAALTVPFMTKNYNDTIYNYQIPFNDQTQSSDDFYIKNIDTILNKLKELFPGCSVSHTLLARGKDGKLYDISKINDKILSLIDTALNNSYIVIDWS
jgi:hypothetical protein